MSVHRCPILNFIDVDDIPLIKTMPGLVSHFTLTFTLTGIQNSKWSIYGLILLNDLFAGSDALQIEVTYFTLTGIGQSKYRN